jgi:hypothetical protein
MEERPPIWRVAANILNKQSQPADKRRSSSLGVKVLTNPHCNKMPCYETFTAVSGFLD